MPDNRRCHGRRPNALPYGLLKTDARTGRKGAETVMNGMNKVRHPWFSSNKLWYLLRTCLIVIGPMAIGLALMAGPIRRNSATYDEVVYFRLAMDWWKSGSDQAISRMGSPVTFWKWQALPALVWLEASGQMIKTNDPIGQLPELLPCFRFSALWIWLVGLFGTQFWANRLSGPWAAGFAGIVYAMGPNLIAHGSLITMECPLWVFWTFSFLAICEYMSHHSWKWLLLAGVFGGMAFSMKFTAVLIPFLCLAGLWFENSLKWTAKSPQKGGGTWARMLPGSILVFGIFTLVMILTNLLITGFATIPLSEQTGDHPWLARRFSEQWAERFSRILEMPLPVDWVGFLTQLRHQQSGGPGYLLGEISNSGWRDYYLVAIGVKVPMAILSGIVLRPILIRDRRHVADWLIPALSLLFLAVACAGSKRNYGFRYLLPVAPMMIVWLSGLVRTGAGRIASLLILAGLAGTTLRAHPWELTYFNEFIGGPEMGRKVLADSNLDWGQGLLELKEMQSVEPKFRRMTLFYFGDVAPSVYGLAGESFRIDASDQFDHLPKRWQEIESDYIAVSTSLSGPLAFFKPLRTLAPIATTPDGSIRIYESMQIQGAGLQE